MEKETSFDIVCAASLYWETTLWQRPQQIMSRLARKRQVLYVRPLDWKIYQRDPRSWSEEKRFSSPLKNLHLYSPLIFPYGRKLEIIRRLNNRMMMARVRRECRKKKFQKKVLWLYSPLGNYLVDRLGESLVVYDCMDDHGSFHNADPALKKSEEWLLKRADLVFAGGKSLYESRKSQNPRCHLFPSAVDAGHFSLALKDETKVPEDLNVIPKPIIGYFGAVDERLDYSLIDVLAEKNKKWSLVFIGPLRKVTEEQLPRRENIHYLGPREYTTLPAYIKGFDVGLMPFALTPLTRMISPTKTPEFLAAGCRVVSTPVPDVVSDWDDLVRIGVDADAISERIREILNHEEPARVEEGRNRVARCSWDQTVEAMEELIRDRIVLQ